MDLKKVEEMLLPYLDSNDLKLYDISFVKEYGYKILRILVDKKGGIDIDTLALVNDYISPKLDFLDEDMGEYMLEVSSPGAEKKLNGKEELADEVGNFIHVEKQEMIYEGYLESFENDILILKINVKGRIKRIELEYADLKNIRLAVNI